MLCSEPIQRLRPSAATTRGGGLRPPPSVVSFVLALNKAHVLALNAAHVLRVNKADVLAINKAHDLRLNTKICPMFTANTKEAVRFEMWECKSDGFEMWERKRDGVLIVLRCGSAHMMECWSEGAINTFSGETLEAEML